MSSPFILINRTIKKQIFKGQKTLELKDTQKQLDEQQGKISNIKKEIFDLLKIKYSKSVAPEEIFYYIYGILYSNTYRKKYNEFLKIDFPKIPFTSDYNLFKKISDLGNKLVDLHLLKDKNLKSPSVKFLGQGLNTVKERKYDEKQRKLYINENQYFSGIELEVWNYYIGGYQILDKWIKDRVGKNLSSEEVNHYIKIINSLSKTIEIQKEVDGLYKDVEKNLIKR